MSVYASTPGFADQRPHPRTLIMIAAVHAVAITAVMTARMDLPGRIIDRPIKIDWIDPIKPPPPQPTPQPSKAQAPAQSAVDHVIPVINNSTAIDRPTFDSSPVKDSGPIIGINPNPRPIVIPTLITEPVRVAARFATPDWLVKPPYPVDKQRLEEEANLKLRLTIDERGRVVAVEPMGSADPSFLKAARKHLMASWRYKPATEDGRPVASSTVITLRFQLEG